MKKNKIKAMGTKACIIHQLTADELQRLELGAIISIGHNHFIQSTDYINKLVQDEIEYEQFEKDYIMELKNN